MLSSLPLAWKEVRSCKKIYNIIVTIAVDVVGHLICRWLDSILDDN